MASTDADEISLAVQLVLQDVWKVVSSLRTTQHSASWLAEHHWKQLKHKCVDTMDKTRQERLSIGIVSAPHSGKSTLINALLGIALLPVDATPVKRLITVHYTPRRKGSKLKLLEPNGKVSSGLEGVRQRLHELLESASDDDWHMEPSLELNAAFCKTLGNEADSVVKLDLMEIPSLSALDQHLFLKERLSICLENLDGMVFLLDGSKLKTDSEADILKELREAIPISSAQLGSRLYFCVTKMDIPVDSEEVDHTETQKYVSNLLQESGYHVTPSQVYVMCPLYALLGRLVQLDKNEGELHSQFGQLVWGADANAASDKTLWKAKAATVLELSGIPRFEEEVLGFLHKNCDAIRLLSLLDSAIRTLEHVLDAAHAFKMGLSRTLNEMRHGMERLRLQLDNGKLQLESTKTELLQIEDAVSIKVRENLTKLKNLLLQRIGTALSCDMRDERPTFELPCGWSNIRQDFLALIHHAEPDRKHAEELITELHEEVIGQIRSEMEISWMVVADLARDRHFEHVLRANQDLDHLSKLLEPVIVKDLNIQIEPADITLKPVSSTIQGSTTELIASAMKQQTVKRNYIYGLMSGTEYKVCLFDGGSIREFFENVVREITDDAIQTLQASIKRHFSGQIASSEEKIRAFGANFVQGIESAIDTRVAAIDASAASMQRVIEDIDSVKKLKNVATSLRRRIETGLSVLELEESSLDLSVRTQKRDETEADDQGRYIPPRWRSEVPTPRLSAQARSSSSPQEELFNLLMDSPKSSQTKGVDGDSWRMTRSGSGTWGSWTGTQTTNLRPNWAAVPPLLPRETPTTAGGTDGFSPRSSFFKNFTQTPRSARGRGSDTPHRSGSWTGEFRPHT